MALPGPSHSPSREEWSDADFDIPDGQPLHTHSDKADNDEEDWDVEMDFGKTGGAKISATPLATADIRHASPRNDTSRIFKIRPPLPNDGTFDNVDDEDEGLSTIKASAFPKDIFKPISPSPPVDDDVESDFALPSDLTRLSLAPLSLNHRASKSSLEWGDKEHTSSSQSSDAYSTLGFADASSSSNSVSSASLPNSEADKGGDDDDDDDSELEGLILPSSLFESSRGGKQLTKILEMKKRTQIVDDRVKVVTPDPEDDFEMGLVIDDDGDLNPSRLVTTQHQSQRQSQRGPLSRSYSMPPRPNLSSSLRPKAERSKSSNHPPPSVRQLNKLRLSPSPPLCSVTCSQAYPVPSVPSSTSPISFLSSKPGSLRGQKSHSGLKPPQSSNQRRLTRKASLCSLLETSNAQASGSSPGPLDSSIKFPRYDAPTAASKAKSHKNLSSSRAHGHEYIVPPTRPSTPSSSAALRLTMPASSRLKSRPSLSSVFTTISVTSNTRSASPLPPRPSSSTSSKHRATHPMNPPPSVPKILRRPKRQRTYGDGTELDAIEDLPTDGEKEGQYRVQPKSHGNRIPGGSYSKPLDKSTVRRKGKRESSIGMSTCLRR
jgi:hypothetical protein